ncbi:coiled-coil domain-containing protein 125 isoform 2-T3 [Mantella aurantiaca]
MGDPLANEHCCPSEEEEDFMAGGDLGEGFGRKPGGLYEATEGTVAKTLKLKKGSDAHGHYHLVKKGDDVSSVRCHGGKSSNSEDRSALRPCTEGYVRCRQNSIDASSEVSSEDLRQRLQDLTEEVDLLRVELDASQRQLDGKDEALKILQSMAVFDKATSHTKEMLQKAEENRRALEKEINVLQWEIEFDQVKLKNLEESWKEKYERAHCENTALKESLELRTNEVKALKAENTIISQQCQELLAMLDVQQQKMFQDNMSPDKSSLADVTALEMAVLRACSCTGPEPCSCAKMSAATRKQLLQLRQEYELEKKSKEEAYVMADAFRIAFEQQLKRRNNENLPLSDIEKLCKKGSKRINSWRRLKENGHVLEKDKNMSLGQKLKSMLISSIDSTHLDTADDPQEVLTVLVDLLNDKEEALAHQRKVSYMLARTIEDKVESSRNHKRSSSQKETAAVGDHHNSYGTKENVVPCSYVTDTATEESHSTKQDSLRCLETSFSLLFKDVYPQKDGIFSDQETQWKEEEEPQS